MREIKFRAMPTYKGGFVYGSLIKKRHTGLAEWMIEDENGLGSDVVTETIGQFTGLLDKNGKEIFEGDILEFKNEYGRQEKYKVFYKTGGLCINIHTDDFIIETDKIFFYAPCADMQTKSWIIQCEVIGNVFENPELLKP